MIDLVGELVEMLGTTGDQRNPVAQLAKQTTGRLVSAPCVGLVEEALTLMKPLFLRGSQYCGGSCKHCEKQT